MDNVISYHTNLSHVHVLLVCISFLCCHCYNASPLSSTPGPLTLTLPLQHLQQPLDALVPSVQRLLLGADSHLHLLHGFPEQEQLLGLPLVV